MMNLMHDQLDDDIEVTAETATDDLELEEEEENSKNKIKKLQAKLKECETTRRQLLDDNQRLKAEFLNARKRLEDQKQAEIERAKNAFIISLLPLCDSFAMAMGDEKVWNTVDQNWRKGVEAIYTQLQSTLTSYNVTVINPHGAEFDPDTQEALGSEDSDQATDTVITVIQKGYERNGEVIRPAKVILSK